jgi:hypothetical protein
MKGQRLCYAALMLIFVIAVASKLHFSTQQYLIHNIDAGYYVEHISEVFTEGYPQVVDPPLAFYYAAAFVAVFGMMLGFKVAIAIASAGIAFPVFKITEFLSGKRDVALLAAFLAAFSPTNMFMMGDLLKNMVGLFFGAWLVYFVIRASERFTLRDAALAALSGLLMVGSHFSSAAYIMAVLFPFLLLRPAYSYWKTRMLTKESVFCLAMTAGLIAAGMATILIKGFDISNGQVGMFGLYGKGEPALVLFTEYAVFIIPVLLAFTRMGRGQLLLFLPWLMVTVLLNQPYFVSEAWTFRFAWDAFVFVAVLTAIGVGYFREDRTAFHGVMMLLGILVLAGFADAGQRTHPVIEAEEWEGLVRLHDERPDIVFSGLHAGVNYWAQAAGFEVVEPHLPGNYLLVCDEGQHRGNPWLDEACIHGTAMPLEAIERSGFEYHFGRFYVMSEESFRLPEDQMPQEELFPDEEMPGPG